MSKNINPDVKRMLSERIAYERKLSEKSKIGYDTKRKTQALVTGTLLATTLSSGISPVFADSRYEASNYKGVGYMSVTEEVGPQGNGGFISSGKGDAGGVSYGLTQLSTIVGSADEFVDNYLKEKYPEFYKFFENADKAGTDSFNEAWTNAYNHNPGEFERIQLENKEVNYVQPSHEKVKEQFGIDLLSTRARTEFLHSTSVQFGPKGVVQLVENSGVTKEMDDEELLSKLSDEKYKSVGTYKFLKCSKEVQNSVRQRFKREKEEYLKIAEEEKGPLLDEEIDYSLLESESSTDEFVETAKSYLNQGTTYKMGGKNTNELDCSGYVSLVYQDMGIDINEMMTNAGKFRNDTTKISRDELKEGDLVFWHDKTGTKHASVFHIGIYVGDDTVVDCSIEHNGVGTRKLSSLQDNDSRYYTFGRYEELQEKINTEIPDIYLDLSEMDEFESDIEISESVEEKFEDTVEDTIEEDESVIDEEAIEEDTTDKDESIIDEEVIEDTVEDTIEEDESVIDEEAIEEDTTDEDESVIDEEVIEDTVEDIIEEDESIIDEEAIEEDTTDEDESVIDDNELEDAKKTETEEDSTVDNEESQDEESQDIQENEENEINEDDTVKDDNSNTEKDDSSINNESDEDKEIINTDKESKSEIDNDSEIDSKEDLNNASSTDEVKKEENSSTDNNTLENNSTDINVDNNIESETAVAMSESEIRIQELEKKLENNLFNKLFRS